MNVNENNRRVKQTDGTGQKKIDARAKVWVCGEKSIRVEVPQTA